MRRWLPVVLIGVAVLWFILTNTGSSMALADFTARPLIALTRDGDRFPVPQPGAPPAEGEARFLGGEGILFGYRFTFQLPDGSLVACTHRFRSLSCSGGWQTERKE